MSSTNDEDCLDRMLNLDPIVQFEIMYKSSDDKASPIIYVPNPYDDFKDFPIDITLIKKKLAEQKVEDSKLIEKVE